MRVFISIAISFFSVIFFSNIVLAAPFLHDYWPSNNTFISGGTRTFYVNITDDNLNTSSVLLHIISLSAYQRGENWDVHTLTCAGAPNEWNCSKSISFAIAGSDTVELFYFDANDTDGVASNNGTATNPLRFTLDRNPPTVSFSNPANNSYVNGNETISIIVTDASSGINNNTVQYSTDNSSWTTLKNVTATSFETVWNTTTFSNNQSLLLYVKASDNVGNNLTVNINVTVDNENPELKIILPSSTTLSGNVQMEVNVSDYYSGLDLTNVRYTIGTLTGTLGCTGTKYNATCTATLATAVLPDGNYTLTFNVTDNATNSKNASLAVTIGQTSISFLEPTNNAFLKETALVRVTTANIPGTINFIELSVEQSGNITTKNMTCNSSFSSCNYSLDTTSFVDGGYTLKAKVINSLNSDISTSIAVTIDNTKPTLSITQPTTDVKGDFEIKADIVDSNLDQSKVLFNISSFNGTLVCTPQTPSRFICSTTFNSKQLSDGKYDLNVSARDKAVNLVIASKDVVVVNQQAGGSQTGGAGPSAGSGQSGGTSAGTTGSQPNKEEKKIGGISFPIISIQFNGNSILVGIVVITVIVIVLILILIVIHKTGKTIITQE